MPGYQTKQEHIAVRGVDDIVIRSLLDRQQFSDPLGDALAQGISSAAWPMFGLLWPSGAHQPPPQPQRPQTHRETKQPQGGGHPQSPTVNASSSSAAASRWPAWSATGAAPT